MDQQIVKEQIITTNLYILQVSKREAKLTIKLSIKVSRCRTEVYQIILNSLKDYEKLAEQFTSIEQLRQYIRDPNHIQVNLETKTIVVIEQSKRKNNKIFEIVSIPLKLSDTIEKKPEQLAQQILQKCSSKNDLSGEQIKYFLENIVLYLFQQTTQSKSVKQKQQEQFINFRTQIQSSYKQLEERSGRIEEWCVNKMKAWELMLQKYHDQLQSTCRKHAQAQKQLDRLKQQKQNRYQLDIMLVRNQTNRVVKQIQQIQSSYLKDINGVGSRVQKLEKLLDKVPFKKQFLMQEKFIQNEKQQVLKIIEPKIWLDSEFRGFDKLVINGYTISALSFTKIFGRRKLIGKCQFTVIFKNIKNIASLGVIDSSYKKDICVHNYNLIQYWNNGSLYVGSGQLLQQCGRGFKKGEPVTVTVDMDQGFIQWRVGAQIRYKLVKQLMKDNSIISWVPYINLRNKDDSVEIYEIIV